MIDFAALAAPFPADRVSWRVGSTTADKTKGMALAYIDARDVYDRLDAVCGPGGWQCRYTHAEKKTVCEIGIKVGDEWVWKANGAGDSDVEAEKGALSDAVKRAAVVWGIGRYLYDMDSPWVKIEARGKSYTITDDGKEQLRRLLGGKAAASRRPEPPQAAQQASVAPMMPAAANEAAASMVAKINMAISLSALESTKKDAGFRADFKMLPAEQRTIVTDALARAERMLSPVPA